MSWQGLAGLPSRRFVCGHCGSPIASERGWFAKEEHIHNVRAYIYVCHQCTFPTFIDPDGNQTPAVAFGSSVSDIPDESVRQLYDEARKATGAGSHTAAVLACRKLLMHIAVSKGAKAGRDFVSYVEYLTDQHYVPPDAKGWVDHIRKRGNEANHEIAIMTIEDSHDLLSFIEMLLKVIYEFPATVRKKVGQKPPAT